MLSLQPDTPPWPPSKGESARLIQQHCPQRAPYGTKLLLAVAPALLFGWPLQILIDNEIAFEKIIFGVPTGHVGRNRHFRLVNNLGRDLAFNIFRTH